MLLAAAISGAIAVSGGCKFPPPPLNSDERCSAAQADAAAVQDPLTLSEAMARALKYNLDNRLRRMPQAPSERHFERVKMDVLPVLAASAALYSRSNTDEQDRGWGAADIRLTWNMLDFGISHLQAEQAAERQKAAKPGRREITLKLLRETRAAYWRAAVMQRLEGKVEALLEDAKHTFADLLRVHDRQRSPAVAALQDLRALLEVVRQLEQMQQTVNNARGELATLINERPGRPIEFTLPEALPAPPAVPDALEEMELLALTDSSQNVTERRIARIDQKKARKALLRLLPGLEFSYGASYDSNRDRINEAWGLAAMRVSRNLFRLLDSDEIKAHDEAREQLTAARRLATDMAIIAKLHLAWQDYRNSLTRLHRAAEREAVDRDVTTLNAEAHTAATGLSRIQSGVRALRSSMGRMRSYAETQNAYGNLVLSLGLDPVPDDYPLDAVDDLASRLEQAFAGWERCALPGVESDATPIGRAPAVAAQVEEKPAETPEAEAPDATSESAALTETTEPEAPAGTAAERVVHAIQVATFIEPRDAEIEVRRWRARGYDDAARYPWQEGDGPLWQTVRIGRYPDKQTANRAATAFQEREGINAIPVTLDTARIIGEGG